MGGLSFIERLSALDKPDDVKDSEQIWRIVENFSRRYQSYDIRFNYHNCRDDGGVFCRKLEFGGLVVNPWNTVIRVNLDVDYFWK